MRHVSFLLWFTHTYMSRNTYFSGCCMCTCIYFKGISYGCSMYICISFLSCMYTCISMSELTRPICPTFGDLQSKSIDIDSAFWIQIDIDFVQIFTILFRPKSFFQWSKQILTVYLLIYDINSDRVVLSGYMTNPVHQSSGNKQFPDC